MGGSVNIGSVASRLGVVWPLAPDAVTISKPVVQYNTSLATLLNVNMTLDIPGMGVRNASARLQIQQGPQLTLQVGPVCVISLF